MYRRFTTLAFFLGIAVPLTPLWSCKYDEYKVKGEATCRPCPMCPVGQGVNQKCMATIEYEPDKIPRCEACIDGKTFSDYLSKDICYPCSELVPNHRERIKCTRFHDREIECKHGFFDDRSKHECGQQCCYCDGQTEIVNKCITDKMEDGKYCAPKRLDGKCDPRIKPTAKPTSADTRKLTTNKPTKPSTAATVTDRSPSTSKSRKTKPSTATSRPTIPPPTTPAPSKVPATSTRTSTRTPPTPKTPVPNVYHISDDSIKYIVIGVVVVVMILVCAVLLRFFINAQGSHGNNAASAHAFRTVEEGDEVRCLIPGVCRRRPDHLYEDIAMKDSAQSSAVNSLDSTPQLPPRNEDTAGPSTRDSSRRISQETLVSQCRSLRAGASRGSVAASTRDSSRRNSGDNLLSPCTVSRVNRVRLSQLRYGHRKELAVLLDYRGDEMKKNWLEFGKYIACHNQPWEECIDRCHECYYGGGSATLAMFGQLSMRKPFLKLKLFIEIADRLGRRDIVRYMNEHQICNELFFQIDDRHKRNIAFKLEKRSLEEKYWPEFADEFGFSCHDIEHFQERKRTPQKYSPTLELIMVLIAHKPAITIDELLTAAISISRRDVYECLESIARRILDRDDRSDRDDSDDRGDTDDRDSIIV